MRRRSEHLDARNPGAAQDRFLSFLQRSLNCLDARAVWGTGTPPRSDLPDDALSVFPVGGPLELPRLDRRGNALDPVFLAPSQYYRIVRDDRVKRREFRVTTLNYIYTVSADPRVEHNELASWHYHPHAGRQDTHVHVGAEHQQMGDLSKVHLPTGRVSFEAVIRFLVSELGVIPAYDDWRDRLDDAERRFRTYRQWT